MGIVKKESNEHEDLLDEVHINLAHESEITQNSVFFFGEYREDTLLPSSPPSKAAWSRTADQKLKFLIL